MRGGKGKRKQRRQRSVDMNSMNHRTLSSSLLWTYDPQRSTDSSLTSMYVYNCVCVTVYLGQGPLEGPHLLGCLAEDQIVSDGI